MNYRIFKVGDVEVRNSLNFEAEPCCASFLAFKKGKKVRFYSLEDSSFSKAFEFINGRWVGVSNDY